LPFLMTAIFYKKCCWQGIEHHEGEKRRTPAVGT
jgi:hypothetical protein